MMKKHVKTKDGEILQFSAQNQIFGRIAIIQQTQKLDLRQIFCYPLGPVPWSLGTSSRELVKTIKSTSISIHELEKGPTCVDVTPATVAIIIDGMAMIWNMYNSDLTLISCWKLSFLPTRIPLGSISSTTFIARAPSSTLKQLTERQESWS